MLCTKRCVKKSVNKIMYVSSVSIRALKHLCFCLLSFCYFLQVPFRSLSRFISVFALLFVLLSYKKWIKIFRLPLFCIYGLYVSFCILIVVVNETIDASKVLRFTQILLMIPLFFCMDESEDGKFYAKAFVRIALLKAIVLFVIYGIVVQTGSYSVIRNYSLLRNWGDIYTSGSIFMTRVQLQGNALLVMACIVAFYKKDRLFYRIALLIATLIAGNRAFLIGLFFLLLYYIFIWFFYNRKIYNFDLKACLLVACVALALPVLFGGIHSILEEKAGFSNAIRKDQARVLLSGNIIVGNGVGNTITAKTSWRDYTGDNYFELQTLYIINQIGVIGYLLFLILTFALCTQNRNSYFTCYIYFIYLAYTFFNPYCFDTTHMIAGFLLCSVFVPKSRKQKLAK